MTLLLLDDHTLFRQSLARILQDRLPEARVREASRASEARAILDDQRVDVLLLDLNLGNESGLGALVDLKTRAPDLRTLVVSMHRDGHHVAAALKAGVQGFVGKDSSVETLTEGVLAVAQGRTWFAPDLLAEASQFLNLPQARRAGSDNDDFVGYRSLTGREQEIFVSLAEGRSVDEVARRLGRSPKTVENHRTAIYQKLGVGDRYELFALARKLGLIL